MAFNIVSIEGTLDEAIDAVLLPFVVFVVGKEAFLPPLPPAEAVVLAFLPPAAFPFLGAAARFPRGILKQEDLLGPQINQLRQDGQR